MTIESLRTPDQRFENLPGYSFEPHYIDGLQDGLRLHYVDEGPADAEHVFLCLHGEPTWAYLYRKMIPVFTAAGHRAVAPDFFGFGRSDKPVDEAVYTFGFHRDTLTRFIEKLDLQNVTLVCQDWGGILGLTLPMDMPERIKRMIVMNTAVASGLVPPGDGFMAWRDFVASNPDLDVGKLMKRAAPGLSDEETAAYQAPFPDTRHLAGVRRFPAIVPISRDMEGADVGQRAGAFLSSKWSGPTFMAVGVQDPVLGPKIMKMVRQMIRGCPEPLMLEEAGHFVQESGDVVARAALEAFATSSDGASGQ